MCQVVFSIWFMAHQTWQKVPLVSALLNSQNNCCHQLAASFLSFTVLIYIFNLWSCCFTESLHFCHWNEIPTTKKPKVSFYSFRPKSKRTPKKWLHFICQDFDWQFPPFMRALSKHLSDCFFIVSDFSDE